MYLYIKFTIVLSDNISNDHMDLTIKFTFCCFKNAIDMYLLVKPDMERQKK